MMIPMNKVYRNGNDGYILKYVYPDGREEEVVRRADAAERAALEAADADVNNPFTLHDLP
jgi:hypothetical protein